MRRRRLWVFQNKTQLTGGGRIIFLIVMGLKIMGQTQFQQLILIAMTKKRNRLEEIPEEMLLQKSM
jgi:hypothetical protein